MGVKISPSQNRLLVVPVKMMANTALELLSISALFYMSLAYPSRYLVNKDRLYSDLLVELRSQQATTGNVF